MRIFALILVLTIPSLAFANTKHMIVVYTMLNSSGEFPNPSIGAAGFFYSYNECQGALLQRKTNKHVLRKDKYGNYIIYSNDGKYIWAESCVPVLY